MSVLGIAAQCPSFLCLQDDWSGTLRLSHRDSARSWMSTQHFDGLWARFWLSVEVLLSARYNSQLFVTDMKQSQTWLDAVRLNAPIPGLERGW